MNKITLSGKCFNKGLEILSFIIILTSIYPTQEPTTFTQESLFVLPSHVFGNECSQSIRINVKQNHLVLESCENLTELYEAFLEMRLEVKINSLVVL